jgi:hypothetical protein
MSQMSLDPGARTSGTQYDAPRASLYDTLVPSTQVPETQVPADARHEHPRREIRSRDTYNLSLIGGCFVGVDVFFSRDRCLYDCCLYMYFIFSFMV